MSADELTVLYLDDALCAVDKPSGLLVHRGYARDDDVLLDRVNAFLGRKSFPLHRLDRGTSGVVLFARDADSARATQAAFARREVTKRYLAFVRGIPPEAGVIDHPVPRVRGSSERLPAVTEFRRLFVFRERYSLVEALPRTGRQHQVRRHLKHISCPLIGDANYGKSEHNRLFRDEFQLARLALHAVELSLRHPSSGEALTITAPLPDDLARPFGRMQIPSELWR